MKNPFATPSFDSAISKGTRFRGAFFLEQGTTMVVDGLIDSSYIAVDNRETLDPKKYDKTTLIINGKLNLGDCNEDISIPNVTITGEVVAKRIVVAGLLALKKGAILKADTIVYNNLHIENGAKIIGIMEQMPLKDSSVKEVPPES